MLTNSWLTVDLGDVSAQAAAPRSIGSVPNPFMADFSGPPSQSGNVTSSALGMLDQGMPESRTQAGGGDLFSAGGQVDLFGGDSALLASSECVDGVDFVPGGTYGVPPGTGATASFATGKSNATPPPRPPPPASAAANGTPRAMSPAVGRQTLASTGGVNKSAFDDLNDSIRMALGGSPSRPAPAAAAHPPQQQPLVQQQQQQQLGASGGFAMFDMAGGGGTAGTGHTVMGTGSNAGYSQIPSQSQVPVGYGSPAKQPMSGDGNQLN